MSSKKRRPYHKRKRAETEEETRRRITEAAVELHGTVGPALTTVTEVAERAGVSRMTVYNHFPTDADLFRACSSHWERRNPFPDPASWPEHADPTERVTKALEELYDWYDRTQGMLEKVLRDAPVVPALGQMMEGTWGGYMHDVVGALSRGWAVRPDAEVRLRAALRLVADFGTWRLLSEAGLTGPSAARLAARMVTGAVSEIDG
jgi:AcrR family transcriptional regulator